MGLIYEKIKVVNLGCLLLYYCVYITAMLQSTFIKLCKGHYSIRTETSLVFGAQIVQREGGGGGYSTPEVVFTVVKCLLRYI